MSYLDFFHKNIRDKESKNNDSITGTCESMCPAEEVLMRKKARLVHVLEVKGPEWKLVKEFSRSAADSCVAVPRLLRPYPVLSRTVQYLLLEVTKRQDVSAQCVYDFVNDRLRAVRQDITIQRLPPDQCAKLLEPMIRFHVFYGYKLCELPLKDFDPVLNKKMLLECMKWFLNCYKEDHPDNLSSRLSNMNMDYNLQCDRVLVECLYLVCNLDDMHPLVRFLTLPNSLKSHPKLNLAYRIAMANLKGNYIAVCRLTEGLCPLTYCAFHCLYLPTLQRRAFQVMSCGYNSKNMVVPLEALRRWLLFNSSAEALAAAEYYGMHVWEGHVRFVKADFKSDQPTHSPKQRYLLDTKYAIFTYMAD